MSKQPFDIELAIQHLQNAVQPFPKAALFELVDQGYCSPFEVLIACIISIRTRDEITIPVAHRLFNEARTAVAISSLTPGTINELIKACTFPEPKARQIQTIACRLVNSYAGTLPCNAEVLLSLPGVGPKCANLVLGIACNQPRIGVDIHVHRVTNRWGYIHARTPEKTLVALEAKLPQTYWVEINRLLVPFGKHICTGHSPRCATCPVLEMCQQVGVQTKP
ncbi:Endonuclease III [uncultured Synechococcales cyanobacterium]|uniref:Endonuclease III n=1 Tax=uncultured Synechococcales cyanobacterium TaxID=1936017 RepID=A0A6J4VPR5_9CYAN|nr:Endonuclease III [uncultured Synechococcales cyanobacterium]